MQKLVALMFVVLSLAGCAGAGGMVKADAPPAVHDPKMATVVFMRSTFVGSAISSSVHDVSGPETKFVGIVQNGTKLAYSVPPGEHVFMVVSEAADFMKATLKPGKTYYALVSPRMGAWKARFSLRPLRQADLAGDDFAKWNAATDWVNTGPEAQAWAQKNAADIAQKRGAYWPEWQGKDQAQRDSQTLNAEDGR